MNFNGLKQIVYQSLLKEKFENPDPNKNNINKIITGVLLFKTLENLIKTKTLKEDSIKETSDQYVKTYKSITESLEGQYISYKQIRKIIEDNSLKDFLKITSTLLNSIYNVYQNKTKIKEFSCYEFSPAIYNITNLSEQENVRLSKVHFNIIVPIIKYYVMYFKIMMKDITVDDVGNRIGTEIKLSINNIPCNQIYQDIETNNINVKEYIRNFRLTSDGFIKLTIK